MGAYGGSLFRRFRGTRLELTNEEWGGLMMLGTLLAWPAGFVLLVIGRSLRLIIRRIRGNAGEPDIGEEPAPRA